MAIQHSNDNEQQTRGFNPNDHLMQIKNKGGSSDYLPVQWRLVWFRSLCPEGTIDTEEVLVDLDREVEEEAYAWNNETKRSEKIVKRARGYARFRAVVTDGRGGRATGTKSETAASFPDYIEKSETGAIGRALAALGYGTQFAPELDEQPRIVDAPVDRNTSPRPLTSVKPSVHTSAPSVDDNLATEQQLSSIRKLRQHLGKPEPEERMTYLDAKTTITALSHEYNEQKQNRKPAEAIQEQSQEVSDVLPAIQRMIDIAKSRVEKLVPAKSWETIKVEALGEAVPDAKVVIGDFTRINGLITKYEREQAA
jgi:hypothetical protein